MKPLQLWLATAWPLSFARGLEAAQEAPTTAVLLEKKRRASFARLESQCSVHVHLFRGQSAAHGGNSDVTGVIGRVKNTI